MCKSIWGPDCTMNKKDTKITLSDGKGLGGLERLTLQRIDYFQHIYGNAICENKGNGHEMIQQTKPIQKYYSGPADHASCIPEKCSYLCDPENHISIQKPFHQLLCHSSNLSLMTCLIQSFWLAVQTYKRKTRMNPSIIVYMDLYQRNNVRQCHWLCTWPFWYSTEDMCMQQGSCGTSIINLWSAYM